MTFLPNAVPPLDHDVARWLIRWADQDPTAPAWADEERRCNFADAETRTARLADWLAREAGVAEGDRIALWLGNRGAVLEALFAAARLGAIALPINARLTAEEVAYQLDDCTPRVVLVEAAWQPRARDALSRAQRAAPIMLAVGRPDAAEAHGDAYEAALESASPQTPARSADPEAPMMLMYTSGTTGKPKGALLPLRKTLYNGLNAARVFQIERSDRVLIAAPLFHSLGLQILALPALFAGASLVIQDGFDAERAWQAIQNEGVTYYGGVPTMHARMLATLDRGEPVADVPRTLRFAFSAGSAAPAGLIRAFHERGLPMIQGYGQTETSLLTCLDSERALRKAGSVGRPVPHARIRLVSPESIDGPVDSWLDVGEGEVGELVVHGPITMLGYWQRPQATAETLRDGWLRTGDLATRDADFDVTLVGRAREMYISGGENVYPAEIEATLSEHPDVAEAAVIGIPDPEWGEVGRAHVVLRADCLVEPRELLAWLGSRLARYKLPREIQLESELPRTASGKVQKHLL